MTSTEAGTMLSAPHEEQPSEEVEVVTNKLEEVGIQEKGIYISMLC